MHLLSTVNDQVWHLLLFLMDLPHDSEILAPAPSKREGWLILVASLSHGLSFIFSCASQTPPPHTSTALSLPLSPLTFSLISEPTLSPGVVVCACLAVSAHFSMDRQRQEEIRPVAL